MSAFKGRFSTEPMGFKLDFLRRKIPLDRVMLSLDFPLCFVSGRTGETYRPMMCFASDKGSVPLLVQALAVIPGCNLRSDTWIKSYYLHDSAYQEGGLWIAVPDTEMEVRWEFKKMTRIEVDLLLLECLEAEGANLFERRAIYAGVRSGGWWSWNQWRKK